MRDPVLAGRRSLSFQPPLDFFTFGRPQQPVSSDTARVSSAM